MIYIHFVCKNVHQNSFQKVKPIALITATLILAVLFSCKEPEKGDERSRSPNIIVKTSRENLLRRLDGNILFLGDSILSGRASFIKRVINAHQMDTCGIMVYEERVLREGFEGFKALGDINGDKVIDSVFILPPFNYCDDGESYYFTDTTLPRLFTISYCCHPDNVFSIGDIDEDGVSEVCIFYSSCASRFKALVAFSLKNGAWKEIGQVTFDIGIMKPDKEERVRKVQKGKFEMLEIIDKEENRVWKQFSF